MQDRETPEARYWKALSNVKEIAVSGSPNAIHFNPAYNNSYIVTASTKVSLIDSLSDKVQRSYSRFTDDAFSGRFRNDGKLIAAGEKTGVVKIFDTQSKSLLRQLRRHNVATRCVRWSADGVNVISGSDDKHALRWDIATEEVLWSSKNHHTDYVRAIDSHPTSNDIFVTGGYDHVVTMWDQRQDSSLWSVNHGNPVEYCLFTPSGSILATVGGSEVKLWDVMSGGRLVHTFNNHQKNITSLALDSNASRLLSAGLDGHVKVYSLSSLEVVHGMKFAAPILSLGLSADSRKMVVGFVDGNLMIRNNKKTPRAIPTGAPGASAILAPTEASVLRPELTIADMIDRSLSQSRHHKGAGQVHEFQNTIIAETERGIHLQPFEKFLKKFSYQKALDSALETKDPVIVITLIEELCRRNGLTIALSGRDETSLEPLLSFTAKYISHARYNDLVIQVAHRLVDMYSCVVGQSDRIDELFMKLHHHVTSEMTFQKDVKRVIGAVDCIINVATMPKRPKLA